MAAEDRFDELLFHLREMLADLAEPRREAEELTGLPLRDAAEAKRGCWLALQIESAVAHDAGWHATHAYQIALELTGQGEAAAALVPDIDFQSNAKWAPPAFPGLSEADARARVPVALARLRELLQTIPVRVGGLRTALAASREVAPHTAALRDLMHLWQDEAFPSVWELFRLTWWLHRRLDPAEAEREDRARAGAPDDDE